MWAHAGAPVFTFPAIAQGRKRRGLQWKDDTTNTEHRGKGQGASAAALVFGVQASGKDVVVSDVVAIYDHVSRSLGQGVPPETEFVAVAVVVAVR